MKKKFFILSWILFVFTLSILVGAFFFLFEKEWVDFSILGKQFTGKPSVVLDDKGEEYIRFELDKRAPVTFEQLPNVLINAFGWNIFLFYVYFFTFWKTLTIIYTNKAEIKILFFC